MKMKSYQLICGCGEVKEVTVRDYSKVKEAAKKILTRCCEGGNTDVYVEIYKFVETIK